MKALKLRKTIKADMFATNIHSLLEFIFAQPNRTHNPKQVSSPYEQVNIAIILTFNKTSWYKLGSCLLLERSWTTPTMCQFTSYPTSSRKQDCQLLCWHQILLCLKEFSLMYCISRFILSPMVQYIILMNVWIWSLETLSLPECSHLVWTRRHHAILYLASQELEMVKRTISKMPELYATRYAEVQWAVWFCFSYKLTGYNKYCEAWDEAEWAKLYEQSSEYLLTFIDVGLSLQAMTNIAHYLDVPVFCKVVWSVTWISFRQKIWMT